MNIIQSILVNNDCFKLGRVIIPKGLMLHSVGCSQPLASAFIKQWNKPGVAKAVHGFIEPNGNVYQTLPFTMRGWHGGGLSNNTHLGFEMTEPSTIKYNSNFGWTDLNSEKTKEFVLDTYKTAVELFSYLCREFGLNPLEDGVIISHSEGNKRGIASNHSDVEHIWSKFNLTMNQFRKDINTLMNGSEVMVEKSFIQKKIVNTSSLNVREKPNAEATTKIVGTLKLNDIVTATGKANTKWYRILFNDRDAFIHGDFVNDINEIDYKAECEQLRKANTELNNKIDNAVKALK